MAVLKHGSTIGGFTILHTGISYGYVKGTIEAKDLVTSPKFVIGDIGENYIKAGTGDGASYSTFNIEIKCWWGLGIRDYADNVQGYYDARTGTWDVKGGYRVNGQPLLTRAEYDAIRPIFQ